MIPKIIHYCWFGGKPYPPLVKKCIASWTRYLPDYELRLWNENRFDVTSVPIVQEAIAAGKWAFAADYIRVYAIYHYGGIYLDTDVEVLKSFDSLLLNRAFIGTEKFNNSISPESAVFGAIKGLLAFKEMMTYYESLKFDSSEQFHEIIKALSNFQKYEQKIPGPIYISQQMFQLNLKQYGYLRVDSFQTLKNGIKVYPTPFIINNSQKVTKETFALHHNLCSWTENRGVLFYFCKRNNLMSFYRLIEQIRLRMLRAFLKR